VLAPTLSGGRECKPATISLAFSMQSTSPTFQDHPEALGSACEQRYSKIAHSEHVVVVARR
jgi:hypothetical protein